MRRGFKVLLWVVLGPMALLLLLGLAWLACNGRWADVDPQPVPSELLPQAVTLAPQENAFFDAQGLRAPQGEAPNAWGQRSWRGEVSGEAGLLALPSGEDWNCNAAKEDCVARWRTAAAGLKAQMANASMFGERCKALAARPSFQEPAPVRRPRPPGSASFEALALPQFGGVTHCMRWLQIEAVLAPDAQRAELSWTRADALLRLFASGSQTLLGQAVGWATAMRQQQLLVQWAARQPAGAVLPAAWRAPLPARLLQPRLWMAAESHFQRETVADLSAHGDQMFDMEPNPPQAWASRHSLGYLPQLTIQAMSAYWLADMRSFGHLQGPALARQVRGKPEPDASWWRFLRWRNTVGHVLVEVGRPAFESYALRQADLVLSQAALDLSQQLNALPAAERPGWWQRQTLDTGVRERLSLEGDALTVRTWRGEVEAAHAAPLRFPLRPG
ncbi:hypothetical protein [Roseateles sp. P5_E1]